MGKMNAETHARNFPPFGEHPSDIGRRLPRTINHRIAREKRILKLDADLEFVAKQSRPRPVPKADPLGFARNNSGRRHPAIFAPITTFGHLRGGDAYIYVGQRANGLVKIGMSCAPEARCRSLGAKLLHVVPVAKSAAKLVETEALRLLRAQIGDGEWVVVSPKIAADAVRLAWQTVGKRTRVDPTISDEEARLQRIASGAQ